MFVMGFALLSPSYVLRAATVIPEFIGIAVIDLDK